MRANDGRRLRGKWRREARIELADFAEATIRAYSCESDLRTKVKVREWQRIARILRKRIPVGRKL